MSIFHPTSETAITKAIVDSFHEHLNACIDSDVIIIGGGPSGLIAARDLARSGVKTLVVERNNFLGGGFWIGGYFMNKTTFRAPSQDVLDELGIPYVPAGEGLYVADSARACSGLIAACLDAGAKALQLTLMEDVVVREGRVHGVVLNWSPVSHMPRELSCLDPIPLEARVVIDATGHEACVARKLEKRGMLDMKGEGALWIEASEEGVVEKTAEVYPGLVVTGMAVAAVHGLARMGPTFGSMVLSGKRAADIVLEKLG